MNRDVSRGRLSGDDPTTQLVLLFESNSPLRGAVGTHDSVDWGRHYGGANFLFADGYVRRICGSAERSEILWTFPAEKSQK